MNSTLFVAIFVIIALLVIIFLYKHDKTVNIYKLDYFDNNGTTEPYDEVLRVFRENSKLGNASADYATDAKNRLDSANGFIKNLTGMNPIWVSGASEGNNQIINSFNNIVTTSYEHKTSLDAITNFGKNAIYVQPDMNGFIGLTDVVGAVDGNTQLVSVIHMNNELGTINDINSIFGAVKAKNPNTITHSDITQSFGKMPIDFTNMDLATLSFHKLGGIVGVGLLLYKDSVKDQLKTLIGGSQNDGKRGGTYNIAGITSSIRAIELSYENRLWKNNRLVGMKNYIISGIQSLCPEIPYSQLYGQSDDFGFNGASDIFIGPNFRNIYCSFIYNLSPNTVAVSFIKPGIFQSHFCNIMLKNMLKNNGIIVSIGSACLTGKPSHVMAAIKAPFIFRCGFIRISLGDKNTLSQCQHLLNVLQQVLSECHL